MGDNEEEIVDEGVDVSSKKVKKQRPVRRLRVTECDTPSVMKEAIIELAQQAMDDNVIPKNMAQHVKTHLDKEQTGTWHVITGSHFGGNVTNDAGTLINFQLDSIWFLVFRSGPPEKKGGH